MMSSQPHVLPEDTSTHHKLYFTLPSLCVVTVTVPKQITQADFDYMMLAINSWKPSLVVKSEL